jgi:hypothetical protein
MFHTFKMPWYLGLPWSESIKKRACRYLLQRYLGQFLEEKLTLDQLTVDLYNGTGIVSEVRLDVQVRIAIVYKYFTFKTRKNTLRYIPVVCLEQGKCYGRKVHRYVRCTIKSCR